MKILFVMGLMVVQFLSADICNNLLFDRNGVPFPNVRSVTVTIIDSQIALLDENHHAIGTMALTVKEERYNATAL